MNQFAKILLAAAVLVSISTVSYWQGRESAEHAAGASFLKAMNEGQAFEANASAAMLWAIRSGKFEDVVIRGDALLNRRLMLLGEFRQTADTLATPNMNVDQALRYFEVFPEAKYATDGKSELTASERASIDFSLQPHKMK